MCVGGVSESSPVGWGAVTPLDSIRVVTPVTTGQSFDQLISPC